MKGADNAVKYPVQICALKLGAVTWYSNLLNSFTEKCATLTQYFPPLVMFDLLERFLQMWSEIKWHVNMRKSRQDDDATTKKVEKHRSKLPVQCSIPMKITLERAVGKKTQDIERDGLFKVTESLLRWLLSVMLAVHKVRWLLQFSEQSSKLRSNEWAFGFHITCIGVWTEKDKGLLALRRIPLTLLLSIRIHTLSLSNWSCPVLHLSTFASHKFYSLHLGNILAISFLSHHVSVPPPYLFSERISHNHHKCVVDISGGQDEIKF